MQRARGVHAQCLTKFESEICVREREREGRVNMGWDLTSGGHKPGRECCCIFPRKPLFGHSTRVVTCEWDVHTREGGWGGRLSRWDWTAYHFIHAGTHD